MKYGEIPKGHYYMHPCRDITNDEHIAIIFRKTDYVKSANLNESMHWHDYYELELILDGSATHIFNTDVYPLKKGASYLSLVTDLHTIHFKPEENIELCTICFDDYYLSNELRNFFNKSKGGLNCCFKEDEIKEQVEKIKRLQKQTLINDEFHDVMVTSILNDVLISFLRKCPVDFNSEEQLGNVSIQKVVLILKRNPHRNISLAEMASDLNISANYLGHLFKREMGMSYTKFQRLNKLERSIEHLLYTNMTLNEISEKIGFCSASYYVKTFQEFYGVTPNEYRKFHSGGIAVDSDKD